MVAASDGKAWLATSLAVMGARLLSLLVHARVRITWDNGSDAAGRSTLAGGNEDEKLHEVVVDFASKRIGG